VKFADALPARFVAVRVKVTVSCGAEAVPEIWPVDAFKVSPRGSGEAEYVTDWPVIVKTRRSVNDVPSTPAMLESVMVSVGACIDVNVSPLAISPLEFRKATRPLSVPDGTRKMMVVESTIEKVLILTLPIAMSEVPVRNLPVNVTVSLARPLVAESELITGLVEVSTKVTDLATTVSNLRKPIWIEDPTAE